jgi:glucosamine-6-phosphate deaminase
MPEFGQERERRTQEERMPIRVIVTRDFNHMSEVGAGVVEEMLKRVQGQKKEAVLGLATGSSPTGMYKLLAKAANAGAFDARRVRSFNLDEYIGLPGDNAQQRVMHPESYAFFMIQEFFSLLRTKFAETCVPYGALVEQERFEAELNGNPGDWAYAGTGSGRSVVIRDSPASEYLAWIRNDIQKRYEAKMKSFGGIDVQVIGSGGKGHVAFHESGIPFEGSRVLIVKMDDNTIRNAVADGHFAKPEDSPRFAVSMGAELVYEARNVVMVAGGERKRTPIARSLLEDPSPEIPISYGQIYAKRGGNLLYVVDTVVGADLLKSASALGARGIEIEDQRA